MAYIVELAPKAVHDIAQLKKTGNKAVITKIDKFNRIIYYIEEEKITVIVVSAKGHYNQK